MASIDVTELLKPVSAPLRLVEARIQAALEGEQQWLTEAYRALFAGGKRMRPAITLLAAGPESASMPEVVALGAALEMLHAATLIHDDIVDEAHTRRGRPTLSAQFGDNIALLAGDHLFAKAALVATETRNIRALQLFAHTLVTISAGELEQHWRAGSLPSYSDYLRLIYAKTACLFESAALGGALLAGRHEEHVQAFATYGRMLGLAFQIADDVLDYTGDPSSLGKPTLKDLQRGLLTLPLLLYLWDRQSRGKPLPEPASTSTLWPELVGIITEGGFAARALEIARQYASEARLAISGIIDGEFAASLEGLAWFAVSRTS
jgi:geranylgeranyl pyrophosphate synthase